jgi:hypothetical protein
MRQSICLLVGLLLLGPAAQAADQIDPRMECVQSLMTAAAKGECQQECGPGDQVCLKNCERAKQEEVSRCVQGCSAGFEGCLDRCKKSSSLSNHDQQRTTNTLLAARCTQLPISCTQNSDCTCSGCCGQLGEGGPKLCQPTCR